MRWLLSPFYNAEERRVRALVRIGLQLAVFLGLWLLVELAFSRLRREGMDRMIAHGTFYIVNGVVVVGSVWLFARFLDRRALSDLGLRIDARWLLDAAFGLSLGGSLMLGIYACESHFGWATYADVVQRRDDLPQLAMLSVAAVAFTSIAIVEELIFRGYQLVNLAEGLRSRFISPEAALLGATLISSLAFGIAHVFNPHADANAAGNVALAGAMLAAGYLVTGELAIPIGLHLGWNFFQNLFGMPVSGQTRFFFAAMVERTETGPDWITGGRFGPEAGMTGLVAMLVGTMLTLVYARAVEGRIGIHRSLLAGCPMGQTTGHDPTTGTAGSPRGGDRARLPP